MAPHAAASPLTPRVAQRMEQALHPMLDLYGGRGGLVNVDRVEAEHVDNLDRLTNVVVDNPLLIDRDGEMSPDAVFSSACGLVSITYSASRKAQNCEGLAYVLRAMFRQFGFDAQEKDVWTSPFLVPYREFAEPLFDGNVFDDDGERVDGLLRFASHTAVLIGDIYYDLLLKESYSADEFAEKACLLKKVVQAGNYAVYRREDGVRGLIPNGCTVVVKEDLVLSSGLAATMFVSTDTTDDVRDVEDDDELERWKDRIRSMDAGDAKEVEKGLFRARKLEIQTATNLAVAELDRLFQDVE